MSVVGTVTAAAAGLAAILSGVNLYVSGRRELDRWTRDALVDALVQFLDTSFKLKSALRTLVLLAPQAEPQRYEAKSLVVAAHDLETDTLTRLRLLASSRVVKAAEALHEADHGAIDAYFAEDPLNAYRNALIRTRVARAQFIEAARSAFRLRDVAAITHHHEDTRFQDFRDEAVGPLEDQGANHSQPSAPSVGQ